MPLRLSWGVHTASASIDSDLPACKREGDRFEVMREKMINDLQSDVDKIKNAILVQGCDGDGDGDSEDPKPWNLRKRKAVYHEPIVLFRVEEARPRSTPRRKRFSLTLSRQEIQEDLLALTARRKPRKPKKRPKKLQQRLNSLFPGHRLSTNIANMYRKVDETIEYCRKNKKNENAGFHVDH